MERKTQDGRTYVSVGVTMLPDSLLLRLFESESGYGIPCRSTDLTSILYLGSDERRDFSYETANTPDYPYGRRPAQHNLEPQVDCREPLSEEFYLQKPAPVLGLSFHLRSSAPGLQVSPFY